MPIKLKPRTIRLFSEKPLKMQLYKQSPRLMSKVFHKLIILLNYDDLAQCKY